MDYIISLLNDMLPNAGTARTIFIIVVGAAVFTLALAVLFLLSTVFDPLQSRLKKLTGEDRKKRTWLKDASQALKPLTRYVEPKKAEEQSHMKRKLSYAGYRQASALSTFYALKIISVIVMPLLVFIITSFYPKLKPAEIGQFMLMGSALGFMLPNIVLNKLVKKRQKRIRDGFPDALDLLVVCAEAGLGLKSAIQRVADEIVVSHEDLARELATVNAEMRAGMENIDALKNLVERTGLSEIKGLVVMLSQSMRFGTSVAETLRIYSEEFREKRMQLAEEQAAKLSIKLLFPLVFCFIPTFLIIGVGPVVIGAMRAFGK